MTRAKIIRAPQITEAELHELYEAKAYKKITELKDAGALEEILGGTAPVIAVEGQVDVEDLKTLASEGQYKLIIELQARGHLDDLLEVGTGSES